MPVGNGVLLAALQSYYYLYSHTQLADGDCRSHSYCDCHFECKVQRVHYSLLSGCAARSTGPHYERRASCACVEAGLQPKRKKIYTVRRHDGGL